MENHVMISTNQWLLQQRTESTNIESDIRQQGSQTIKRNEWAFMLSHTWDTFRDHHVAAGVARVTDLEHCHLAAKKKLIRDASQTSGDTSDKHHSLSTETAELTGQSWSSGLILVELYQLLLWRLYIRIKYLFTYLLIKILLDFYLWCMEPLFV